MSIFRTIPDVRSLDRNRSKTFYCDLLGFKVLMDQAGMMMFGSGGPERQQVTVNGDTAETSPLPRAFRSMSAGLMK